ncbi:hypothetical protein [Gemella cuniculi]|uniref:hypothetical protein n=1 Tax=Gemella cuniculi TaxID=150240 RepID=UPI0004097303|nr:hypothetical protein [Gemella cuniculi]
MSEILDGEVEGKVSEVTSSGLFLNLANGKKAFLPKENMHIGKKKKLVDIFSEGFVIRGNILSKKKDYYVLTQKEIKVDNNKEKKELQVKNKKTKQKNKESVSGNKLAKISHKVVKIESQGEDKSDKKDNNQEKTTLKDLKKLQYIGNMKISVGRGKKSNISKLAEEKEEILELLPVPENFLENIISTTASASKRFSDIKEELRKRGYLDEN